MGHVENYRAELNQKTLCKWLSFWEIKLANGAVLAEGTSVKEIRNGHNSTSVLFHDNNKGSSNWPKLLKQMIHT